MKIAIDASRAVNETAGIGRYSRELIKALLKTDRTNQYLLLFSYFRKDATKEKMIQSFKLPNTDIKVIRIPGNLKEKAWGWRLPWFERYLKGVQVFFAPSFFEMNLGLKIPQVVTCFDLTTFLFPEHRGQEVSARLNARTKVAYEKAARIIAISTSTAQDLKKILKVTPRKIRTVYPGQTVFPEGGRLPASLKNRPYILTVGTLEPRKNLTGLLKAYALLPVHIQEKHPLVVVGAKGWQTTDIFTSLQYLKLGDKVKMLGYVTDQDLGALYKQAALFVYPSLYEGFGFPVLEALAAGVPTVTSNISSLPEVAEKAALLVDPNDPSEISGAMQKIIEHKTEAERLKKAGPRQAQKFSWDKAARATIKIFEEIK